MSGQQVKMQIGDAFRRLAASRATHVIGQQLENDRTSQISKPLIEGNRISQISNRISQISSLWWDLFDSAAAVVPDLMVPVFAIRCTTAFNSPDKTALSPLSCSAERRRAVGGEVC